MCKVRLFGLKSGLKATAEALEEYGGAEIKQLSSEHDKNAEPLEEHSSIVEKLLKTEAMVNSLEAQEVTQRTPIEEIKKMLSNGSSKKTEKEVEAISSKLETINTKLDELKEETGQLKMFAKFDMDFSQMSNGRLSLTAGIASKANKTKAEEELAKTGFDYTSNAISKENTLFIVAVPKGTELNISGFERTKIPEMKSAPKTELKELEKMVSAAEKEKEATLKELREYSKKNYAPLLALKEYLTIEEAKASLPRQFIGTEKSFAMEAYLPEKKYNAFEKFAAGKFGNKVHLEMISGSELEKMHENTPTLTEHSTLIKPFEQLTKFISIPKSNELDTTLIFLIFFPLFYGIIVGDFVYGIISFFIAKRIFDWAPKDSILNPVAIIWMWGAIPTMIFGLIFDEFAGMSNEQIFTLLGFHDFFLYHGLERIQNIELLLPATILLGVFTMAMGFLLGYINASRHGDRKHAAAKLGWFGMVVFGTIAVSTAMFNAFPQEFLPVSGALMIVSLVPIMMAEGVVGLMEIPSVVGNVLSFARLLAVGLVGGVIAMILNQLAFPGLDKGLLLILLLPLYIGVHLFNVFLAMFEALIQGARLNFVEFYSKFYEGGGKEFAPFKFTRKYIKE